MTLRKALWFLVVGWLYNTVQFVAIAYEAKSKGDKEKYHISVQRGGSNLGAAICVFAVLMIAKWRKWK